METIAILSKDELTFTKRMLPHFMAGKSPAEAAQAVLDDDCRLLNAICADSGQINMGDFNTGYVALPFRVAGLRQVLTDEVMARYAARRDTTDKAEGRAP